MWKRAEIELISMRSVIQKAKEAGLTPQEIADKLGFEL